MSRNLAVVAALLLGACTTGGSTTATTTTAETTTTVAGPERAAVADIGDDLQARLDEWVQQNGAFGTALAVLDTRTGEEWTGASGFSDRVAEVPLEPDDHFRIASVTKPFVATVVLLLVEEGLLDLEDPISHYVDHPGGDEITVRMLLEHTSGIPNYVDDRAFLADLVVDLNRSWTPDDLVSYVLDDPPGFAPGSDYDYTNTGYVLLGQIIEAATGSTVGEQLRARIFEPAGLERTYFAPDGQPPGGIVHGYTDFMETPEPIDMGAIPQRSADTAAWTAGGIISSAPDVARFAEALFAGELMSPESLELMRTPTPYEDYGFGLDLAEYRGYVREGHGGFVPGFTARLDHFPELGLVVAIVNNSEQGELGDLRERVIDLVLDPDTGKSAENN